MKKMNGNGKLALHRETLAALDSDQLDGVVGGAAAAANAPTTVSVVASYLAPSYLRTFCRLC